jgi:hypothetical protein
LLGGALQQVGELGGRRPEGGEVAHCLPADRQLPAVPQGVEGRIEDRQAQGRVAGDAVVGETQFDTVPGGPEIPLLRQLPLDG